MQKSELRKIYLDKRNELSPKELREKSLLIAEAFFRHFALESVKFLHTFLPIKKFNEIDTYPIIEKIWRKFPQIETLAPRIDFQKQIIESFTFDSQTKLTVNAWRIYEPENTKKVENEEIDLILVPLLCFDKTGFRVGYGKGFYDKFLEQCRPNCHKIGLSLFPPIEKISDTNSLDVRLDFCLTPIDIFQFS